MKVFILLVSLSAIVWWPVNSQTELFAYEGDKVFIPCCNTGEDISIWTIDGSSSSPVTLSNIWSQLQATAHGIIINSVSFDLILNFNSNAPHDHQNVSFKCFTHPQFGGLISTVVLTIGAKSELAFIIIAFNNSIIVVNVFLVYSPCMHTMIRTCSIKCLHVYV